SGFGTGGLRRHSLWADASLALAGHGRALGIVRGARLPDRLGATALSARLGAGGHHRGRRSRAAARQGSGADRSAAVALAPEHDLEQSAGAAVVSATATVNRAATASVLPTWLRGWIVPLALLGIWDFL